MAKAVLLAWSSPASPDSAAEYEEWYRRIHLPDVRAAVPAIISVARYELVDPESPAPSARYLTIYEIDDADVTAAAAALAESAAAGRLRISPALDVAGDPPDAQWYRGLQD
jgi:hypothetical protein